MRIESLIQIIKDYEYMGIFGSNSYKNMVLYKQNKFKKKTIAPLRKTGFDNLYPLRKTPSNVKTKHTSNHHLDVCGPLNFMWTDVRNQMFGWQRNQGYKEWHFHVS